MKDIVGGTEVWRPKHGGSQFYPKDFRFYSLGTLDPVDVMDFNKTLCT